jgi:aminodeoxyfutalosine deaminase
VIVFAASWILPVSGPPVRDGRVAVDDAGVIQWVGRGGEAGEPAGRRCDLGAGVLMPGLVNAHCHLELSHLDGLAKRTSGFVPWVEALVAERGSPSPASIQRQTERAVRWIEEETATVAIGDISNTLTSVEPLAASGLRAVVFHEVLGWDGAQAGAVLAAADARLAAVPSDLRERVPVKLAAHAPHSVSPALFAALAARGGPAAIHLAESPSERDFLRNGGGDWPVFLKGRGLGHVGFEAPQTSPVAYLDRLGALHERLLAAHVVQSDAADAALLARRGVSVVVCPGSNRNLGVGVPPVDRLHAAGVRVCLGTDSLASGDSLDVAVEMAEVARLFPDLPAREIVRMATASGAAALGFDDLGTLSPGRRAALAFAEAPVDLADPERFVVSGQARLRRARAS